MKIQCLVAVAALSLACNKLAKSTTGDAGSAAPDDAGGGTALAPASAAPSASAAEVGTAAKAIASARARAADSAAGKKPMAVPSPTTDRFPRNRLKDGPCPAGFVEQPGAEEHSSCARSCKTESDCHAHTCVDSDVGGGKVCSNDAAKGTSRPAANVPKCTGEERLWALGEKGKPFCAATDCTSDKDCKGKGTCLEAMMLNEDGSPTLSHNGTPMGMKVCKPK